MSDLSFVAGEFPRLASSAREAAEAVRSARPEGGASAFASAMPGTNLSSKMQGVEDKFADQATKTGTSLDEHAESLLAAERDFIAAEEENGQLIGSIIEGHSYGAGAAAGASEIIGGHSYGASRGAQQLDDVVNLGQPKGHSKGATSPDESWRERGIRADVPVRPSDIPSPVKDAADSVARGAQEVASDVARGAQVAAESVVRGAQEVASDVARGAQVAGESVVRGAKEAVEGLREAAENFDPTKVAGPMMGPPSWLDDIKRK